MTKPLRSKGTPEFERAVTRLSPEEVIAEIEAAGLRGRGGSGYPAAEKWRAVRASGADRRIVIANLMGADPSALGDRALAEGNPHLIVEGALIAAYASGAGEAIVAVRREWTEAIQRLRVAAAEATDAHLAGYLMFGTDTSVQLSIWEGSGAYVAGEETALIAALSGDRGMPLIRPPYPTERGLWTVPSVVQNAETLAHAAWILSHSADAFASVGTDASRGTKLVTVMGRVAEPGLLEVPLGTPLLAVADGTIFSVGWNDLGGYRLWLRDRQGNQFYYAHLSAFEVSSGESVLGNWVIERDRPFAEAVAGQDDGQEPRAAGFVVQGLLGFHLQGGM